MSRLFSLYFLVVLGLVGMVPGLVINNHSSAQTVSFSSWLKTEPPNITTIKSEVTADLLPMYSSKDCLPNTKFVTIQKDIKSLRSESSYSTCAIQTSFGQQSANTGQIKLNDTDIAGTVKSSAGNNLTLIAIPNSNHILYVSGSQDGFYLFLVKDFIKNSTVNTQPDGTIYYQLKPNIKGSIIKDPAGNSLIFADTRFSDNGKWMIGDVPGKGMTKVNIETGESLTFGPVYNYSIGLRPKFVSTISGDGRYAFVAEYSYEILKVYDLSTCKSGANSTGPANCQSRNLLPEARVQIAGYKNIYFAQFSTNYSIRLYAQYTGIDKKDRYGLYLLTANGEKESSLDYLALGDSFASGEGAYNYKTGTDINKPFNKCHLSSLSYPYILRSRTKLNEAQSVACSGAKMKDLRPKDGENIYNTIHKQSEGKQLPSFDDEIYQGFLAGYRPQLNFVERNKPKVVTISVSGNDIGFGQILLACLKPGTCYTSPQERLNLVHTINSKFDDLVGTFSQVKNQAGVNTSIYALGYPSLADPSGNCAVNVHLDKQEIIFSNQIINYLNSVIMRASQKAGVKYIDVEKAFYSHRLCETDSADVAVNGLTAGDDKTFTLNLKLVDRSIDVNITGRESYHPNQLGHRLYADVIAGATNNMTTPSPDRISNISNPNESNAGTIIDTSTNSLSPRKIRFEEGITNNILLAGQPFEVKVDNLKPASDLNIWVKSESEKIGSYKANNNGQLSANPTISGSVVPGWSTIHLYAQNLAGEDIDIQKSVYIASSSEDLDGDGINNKQEECLSVEPAHMDRDKDNADDACDNFIDKIPAVSKTINLTPARADNLLRGDAINTINNYPIYASASRLLSLNSAQNLIQPAYYSAVLKEPKISSSYTSPDRKSPTSKDRQKLKILLIIVVFICWWGRIRWRKIV